MNDTFIELEDKIIAAAKTFEIADTAHVYTRWMESQEQTFRRLVLRLLICILLRLRAKNG